MAWSNRPYLFNGCLEDAVKLYKQQMPVHNESSIESGRSSFPMSPERGSRPPSLCFSHEHPLRIGLSGKLYSYYDMGGPIMDTMSRMHVRRAAQSDPFALFDACAKRARANLNDDQREVAEECAARQRESRFALEHKPAHSEYAKWRCALCGSKRYEDCVARVDGLVCPCGHVVRTGGDLVSLHRQHPGAPEEEDTTQHADTISRPTIDKFDGPPENAATRRSRRRANAIGSNVGGTTHRAMHGAMHDQRMRQACRIVERVALRDTSMDGSEPTPREELKLQRILEALEALFKALTPVDRAIQRLVRKRADKAWTCAIRHARVCACAEGAQSHCHVRLQDYTPQTIATVVFIATLEHIADGGAVDAPVEPVRVAELRHRTSRAAIFGDPSHRVLVERAKPLISRLLADDFDFHRPCASEVEGRAVPQEQCANDGAQDAHVDALEPKQRKYQKRVVQAVQRVFEMLNTELRIEVREEALVALDTQCIVRLLHQNLPSPHQSAFCLLYAIGRVSAHNRSTVSPNLNVYVANHIKLDLATTERIIEDVRVLVTRHSHCAN